MGQTKNNDVKHMHGYMLCIPYHISDDSRLVPAANERCCYKVMAYVIGRAQT